MLDDKWHKLIKLLIKMMDTAYKKRPNSNEVLKEIQDIEINPVKFESIRNHPSYKRHRIRMENEYHNKFFFNYFIENIL